MTLNNLVTTVATPRKNVDLVCPSIWCPNPWTSTNAPRWSAVFCVMPEGYISETVGANIADAERVSSVGVLTHTELMSLRSLGRVRGYVARSSCGANWAGFTKMESTVRSLSSNEFFTEWHFNELTKGFRVVDNSFITYPKRDDPRAMRPSSRHTPPIAFSHKPASSTPDTLLES